MHRMPLWLAIFILLFQLVLAIGGSANGADVSTLWYNQELPIHMEVEIHDGDRLKLGNEEFIFNV